MKRGEEGGAEKVEKEGGCGPCKGKGKADRCQKKEKKGCGPCGSDKVDGCQKKDGLGCERKEDDSEKKGRSGGSMPCGTGNKSGCCDGGRADAKEGASDDVTTPLLAPSAPFGTARTVTFAVGGITCSDCSQLVEGRLRKKQGVLSVQVSPVTGRTVVTYDTAALNETAIQKEIEALGHEAELLAPASVARADFGIAELLLAEEAKRIEGQLTSMPGVAAVSVVPETQIVSIDYLPLATGARTLMEAIEGLGFTPTLREASASPSLLSGSQTQQEISRLRRCFWVSAIFGLPVLLIAFVVPYVPYVSAAFEQDVAPGFTLAVLANWLLATPIQFYVGYPLYLSAYRALFYGRTANMDTLVVLSTTTAYVYSLVSVIILLIDGSYETEFFFETSAILLMLIMLGRYLEAVAKGMA